MTLRKQTKKNRHRRKQSKTRHNRRRQSRQSGGNYGLATDITVGGVPMRHDTVIVSADGSSMTAKEMKALEEL
jgi:hypothetical protein